MTDIEAFLAHLLAKPGSSLACRDDESTTVEIQHFSTHSGRYPTRGIVMTSRGLTSESGIAIC